MILSATFSKPTSDVEVKLGHPYIKIRFWYLNDSYEAEFFTKTQSFRKHFSPSQFEAFVKENAGITFKNVIERTEEEEITILSNRHGKIKALTKKIQKNAKSDYEFKNIANKNHNRQKNYILKEGEAIPFLVELGIMSKDGKVLASKYDKFKQINRFLEYIKDITEELIKAKSNDSPLTIIDFGSGKSYLTFAVHYYLSELQHIPVKIYGLDLKKDVIENCTALAAKLGLIGLEFSVGDIATFKNENASKPNLIITLHACDTATDYALNYAIKKGATAILSVPCCQHEINLQLEKQKSNLSKESHLASICHWGLLRERFSSLATDAIRAELLEQSGYSVQILEFIDMTHTPKNIMIRAVKKSSNLISSNSSSATHTESSSCLRAKALLEELQVSQTLFELLKDSQETQK